jgi:hypothetical protein
MITLLVSNKKVKIKMNFYFGVLVGAAIVAVIWYLYEDYKMDKYLTRLERLADKEAKNE